MLLSANIISSKFPRFFLCPIYLPIYFTVSIITNIYKETGLPPLVAHAENEKSFSFAIFKHTIRFQQQMICNKNNLCQKVWNLSNDETIFSHFRFQKEDTIVAFRCCLKINGWMIFLRQHLIQQRYTFFRTLN